VNYSHFKTFDHAASPFFFPGKIDFYFFSEEDRSSLEIKIDRLEFDVPVEPSFKIPAKYKKMN
jgi:hypothetical protein